MKHPLTGAFHGRPPKAGAFSELRSVYPLLKACQASLWYIRYMNQKALFWAIVATAILVLLFAGFSNFLVEKEKAPEENEATEEVVAPATDDEAEALESVLENMIGSWKSVDDQQYVLVLKGDNTYQDVYDKKLVNGGAWLLFTNLADQGLTIEANFENSIFLEKRESGSGELFHYNIAVANGEELTMTYLQGGVLRFKRVK